MVSDPAISSRRGRGFTLIEIMVVLAIIIVLAAISIGVGMQVKILSAKKYTATTLTLLRDQMKDYLGEGNPEPGPTGPVDTNPASDPVNWVKSLTAFPKSGAVINKLTSGVDGSGNKTILDGFGTPIRYIPSAGTVQGYFQSAGPDRVFETSSPPPVPAPKKDDMHSYDAS